MQTGNNALTAESILVNEGKQCLVYNDLPSKIALPSKFIFSFRGPLKGMLEPRWAKLEPASLFVTFDSQPKVSVGGQPMVSLGELTAHEVRCDAGELSLRIIPGVLDTATNKEVVKISLQWDLSNEFLANMMNQTVKVYSSVKDSKDSMLKSRQSHGTFEINEKDNPLLLVFNLCIHDEVMSWDDETVTIVIEVVHNQ